MVIDMMRIITGSARGTKLLSNDGFDIRPTSERAKEALFSAIQFDIKDKDVLDLFAGTGQLALEALSRGAKHAVLVDSSRESLDLLNKNAEKTHLKEKCDILASDYMSYLSSTKDRKFDIIFLDPPYKKDIIPKVLEKLCENNMLSPSTIIICESENSESSLFGDDEILKSKFRVVKSSKYSIPYITILKPAGMED